jgi:hypothetical protein
VIVFNFAAHLLRMYDCFHRASDLSWFAALWFAAPGVKRPGVNWSLRVREEKETSIHKYASFWNISCWNFTCTCVAPPCLVTWRFSSCGTSGGRVTDFVILQSCQASDSAGLPTVANRLRACGLRLRVDVLCQFATRHIAP